MRGQIKWSSARHLQWWPAPGGFPRNFLRHYYDRYCLPEEPSGRTFIGTAAYAARRIQRFRSGDNLDIASKLGCLGEEGLAAMRRGNAPTVRRGPYTGDKLSVDHIIPRAVCPDLDNVIANLELMPLRMNESKHDKIGDRQLDLAKKLHAAGLLSAEGKQKIDAHPHR